MRFTMVFEQEADGGYVVTVPALPGCVSEGDPREEGLSPTSARRFRRMWRHSGK